MWHTGHAVRQLLDEREESVMQFGRAIGELPKATAFWLMHQAEWHVRYLRPASLYLGKSIDWLVTGREHDAPRAGSAAARRKVG